MPNNSSPTKPHVMTRIIIMLSLAFSSNSFAGDICPSCIQEKKNLDLAIYQFNAYDTGYYNPKII